MDNQILHPSVKEIAEITGLGTEDLLSLIEQYDIFSVSFPDICDHPFIVRGITSYEYKQVTKVYQEDNEIMDAIYSLCVIWPKEELLDTDPAGISNEIVSIILQESGFSDDQDVIKAKIDASRAEMDRLDNQIPCIVHEAFPDLNLETIMKFPLSKLIFYYTRAEWVLANYRLAAPEPTGQQQMVDKEGNTYEQATTADSPELRAEKAFYEGKLRR